jgi:ribonucrease Y
MSFFSNLSSIFGSDKKTISAKSSVKKTQATANRQIKPSPKLNKNKPHVKAQKPQAQAAPSINTDYIVREAKAKAREIVVEAKDEALIIKSSTEKKAREIEQQLIKQQNFLDRKLDKLDERLTRMDEKNKNIEKEKEQIVEARQKIEKIKEKVLKQLEKISGMTKNQATVILMEGLEKKLSKDMAQLVRQKAEEAKQEADERAREILIDAMRHGATDYVAEYTVSVITIPSEEIKGKIIGKSGRNIHAFERYTGVDIDLDASPTEVKLSCFDPIRREIARISLEKLIKDGRIQPARIEEVVDKVKKEIDKTIVEAGKYLCHKIGVYNISHGLMKILGRFKYRFSYGQNMINHTIEETKIGIKLAHELGVDVNIVKLGCLLHDVGKVADETEGSHVELGVKIAKKFGMPQAVIDCIAQHHEDESFSGPEQMAVYIADAISGARPGARYENLEEYIERLKTLEEIANSYEEVKESYAIQAGRELRVLLKPEESKDDDVQVLALKIKDEIKEKVTYPGYVTVTVIRETKAQETAK